MQLAKFINQKDDEKVILEIRRHPITLVPSIILFFFALLLPPILWIVSANFLKIQIIWSPLYNLLISTYYIVIIVYFYVYTMDFYLDVLILTNDRLIDVDQHSLFSRRIAEMDLYQVQDVSTDIKGILATAFNFGTVHIQNASLQTKFTISQAKDPDKLREMILELADEDRKHHSETDSFPPTASPLPTSQPSK
jgi:membrane protein YdbS with pleckstrin-like domain